MERRDDNVGTEAASYTTETVRASGKLLSEAGRYSKKLRDSRKEAIREADSAAATGKSQQERKIKREYQQVKHGEIMNRKKSAAGSTVMHSIGEKVSSMKEQVWKYVSHHPQVIMCVTTFAMLIMVVSSSMSSCSAFLPGGSGAVIATTYTAEDPEIIGTNEEYKELEKQLDLEINRIEQIHPDFDEYRYELDEIGHDPYQLASYLTIVYEDYTEREVKETLEQLFDLQYELVLEETVEVRSRQETRTGIRNVTEMLEDPQTGELTEQIREESYEYEVTVEYEYRILNITLINHDLAVVIAEQGEMDEDQTERYEILNETKGNKAYLFGEEAYVATEDIGIYEIPGEALTDTRFSNMIREAERYLGYEYVWGGSSPATGFDCSGFVSYVINHCGNGWDVGRLTANGLSTICSSVSEENAKPGDLIFFQGTYHTTGMSHVGIYVGNGMMLHAGNPIQYASINTSYWQSHLAGFGRLP